MQKFFASNLSGFRPRGYNALRVICTGTCGILVASVGMLHAEEAQIPNQKAIVSTQPSGQGDQEFLQKVETGQIPDAKPALIVKDERATVTPPPVDETHAPATPDAVKRRSNPDSTTAEETRRTPAEKKATQTRGAEPTPARKVIAREKQKDSKKPPQGAEPPMQAASAPADAGARLSETRSRERTALNPVAASPVTPLAAPLPPGTTVTTVTTRYKGADGRYYTSEKKTTTYPQPERPKFRLFHRHDQEATPAPELTPFVGSGR